MQAHALDSETNRATEDAANRIVSIIIPCFNAEPWISQALESCLSQNWENIEIIVVDDGSTDGSRNVISRYSAAHPDIVRVIRQSNQGAPTARNAGISAAAGNFLLFLDADDYLEHDAVQFLMSALSESGDIAYGNVAWIDSEGHLICTRDQSPPSPDAFIAMLEQHPAVGSILVHRRIFEKCRWKPKLPCAQEVDLFVTCALLEFDFRFVKKNVAFVRHHRSPTRISEKAAAEIKDTLISLYLGFQEELIRGGRLLPNRKASLHYALLGTAIQLWREGRDERARQVFKLVDRDAIRVSHRFKRLSYHSIALAAGLRTSQIVWRMRDTELRLLAKVITLFK